MRGVVGWSGRLDEAALEVCERVDGVDTGESVQWGVVQWRLPEVLCELQREQGNVREMSVEHGQCMSLCVCMYTDS